MALPANLNKRFFPSYGQIQQTIVNEHKRGHNEKLSELQNKIATMKQVFNLQQEHEQIKNKLLQNYYSTNHQYMKTIINSLNDESQKLQKQNQNNILNIRSTTSAYGDNMNNAYSLNYCIDDDMQEDNHYENHLKFKKQVLQRDLFQNTYYRPDKKKVIDEQYIFKNLYNTTPNTPHQTGSAENFKVRRPLKNNYLPSQNSKEFKQNMKHFKHYQGLKGTRKIGPKYQNFSKRKDQSDKRIKRQVGLSAVKKCLRKQANQDQFIQQHEICQKNTKILKESYGKYLKELQGTNIIKWRILGGQKQKQRQLISQSISMSGLGVGVGKLIKHQRV